VPFVIAQIFGFIVVILCMIMPHMKTKSSMLGVNLAVHILQILQFLLLSATPGVYSSISATIRSVILFLYARKQKRAPKKVLVGLIILQIGMVIYSWESWWSICVMVAVTNIYGQWQKDLKITRIMAIVTSIAFGIYSWYSGAYVGVMNELLLIYSTGFALWRFRNVKQISD